MSDETPTSVAGGPLQDIQEYGEEQFDDFRVIFNSWTRGTRPSPSEVQTAISLYKEYAALIPPHNPREKQIRWGAERMAIRMWATDASMTGDYDKGMDSTAISPFVNYMKSLDETWASRWRSEWSTGPVEFQFPQCVRAVDTEAWLKTLRSEVPASVSDDDLRKWAGRVLANDLKFYLADCMTVAELLIEDICDILQQRADYDPRQILCAATYFGGSAIYAVNNLIRNGLPNTGLVALTIEEEDVQSDFMRGPLTSSLRMSDLSGRAKQAAAAALRRKASFSTSETKTVTRTVKEQKLVTEYREVKKLFGTKRIPEQVMREVEQQVQETVPTGNGTWRFLSLPLQRTLRLNELAGTWQTEETQQVVSLSSYGEITSEIQGEPETFDPVATIERMQRQGLTWENYDESSVIQHQAPWHTELITASDALGLLLSALDGIGK
ncbi:MAG: hypothetical protein LBL92_02420 [Propionibacteriaceae bacterium]|jgi:hypothetical protein|nr:hypothetical protein [Propionibacteriaceae bacterium]